MIIVRRQMAFSLSLFAMVLVSPIVACSSEGGGTTSDAGASDGTASGDATSKLPGCVTEGFQCQPKGCNAGYQALPGYYDCGNSGGTCCGKAVAGDAGSQTDASAMDATSD